jgi:LuxR family maltose regulon positive regulatory protein
MPTPILATKLSIPPPRAQRVHRPRLVQQLNAALSAGRQPGVTLISAPAGFGKTTLISEWLAGVERPVAWLSLDESDNDPARFLAYLVAALQQVAPSLGTGVARALQSPQPPPAGALLTELLNEIAALPGELVLILDDVHVLAAGPVEAALSFLLAHLPPLLHLVLATRQDPRLPLARYRAGGQLTELRAAHLRFTPAEAAEFLNAVMGLQLSAADVAALEARTEGWIAGLQLAAIAMQGHPDARGFIQTFAGGHHFVLDYLLEEVLQRQPEPIQRFLLRTALLARLCGPLCDALLPGEAASGQAMLEYLERANLFIVALDGERGWYRYHQLFADLLRQRLPASLAGSGLTVDTLHVRASDWLEAHHLDIEAFQHAAAAQDLERVERLIEGRGIPLHQRGAVTMILDWLAGLPVSVLNSRPWLWWQWGALLLVSGQTTGVDAKLDAAEAALAGAAPGTAEAHSLAGRIAAARATLALTRYQVPVMLAQSQRALDTLGPEHLSLRANAYWTLAYAHLLQGERAAARAALIQATALSQAGHDTFTAILATIGLGVVQEGDLELGPAAETYREVLALAGEQPLQIVNEAHLGLARVLYEWNDLDGAEQHGRQSLQLARQYDQVIDRYVIAEVFMARLKLARGDADGAAADLAHTSQLARQKNFALCLPEVAAAQVMVLLRQGAVAAAAQLAHTHPLPLSQARVLLAQGQPAAALAALEPWAQQAEACAWQDERLKVRVVQALAHQALGELDAALPVLSEALALAEPSGCLRTFLDEGQPLAQLLGRMAPAGGMLFKAEYIHKLRSAFDAQATLPLSRATFSHQPLSDALSPRELEVLQLIAQGLSNQEISARLFVALDTVKGHNRRIFDKLRVQRRTEAVARARELGVL